MHSNQMIPEPMTEFSLNIISEKRSKRPIYFLLVTQRMIHR